MSSIKKLLILLCLLAMVSGCAAGRSAFNKGEKFEQEGKLDEAILKYAQAAADNPEEGEYRLRFLKASEKGAHIHFDKGDEYFAAKKYDDAFREYQTAFSLDPSLDRAKQQCDLVSKIRNGIFYYNEGVGLEKDRKIREALQSYRMAIQFDPNNKEAGSAIDRLLKSRRTKLNGELNLKSNKPITLKFKDAKIKEVFNILSQLSGINFIFDEGLKDNNISIYLENATFQQALDVLTGINKLGEKVLNESTIIIYPKTPEKIRQYQDLVVKTFFLNKLDAKKAVNLIRTMLQVKKIYVNEEMNALVIRDTPEVIDVAQKIIEANDIPDAEVVLDVEVIEVSKNNEDNFGLALSKYAVSASAANQGTLLSDVLTTPTVTATTTGTTTTTNTVTAQNLLDLFRWHGYDTFITVPNAAFNFAKTLSHGETLANPKLRVMNREKAKFNVGQRVPITTTSSPTGGGVSVNVQYVDVGVKLNAEPTVELNNDVTLKISLEVSSILSKETVGTDQATTVVTIGTRNLDTVLSLKDGETSIIGGLLQGSKNRSTQKVFLLGDIPVIGTLFSGQDNTNNKNELILAITPHIVRGLVLPDPDVATFWSGKEDEPSLSKPYASFEEPEVVPASAAIAPVPQPVPSVQPQQGAIQQAPQPVPPASVPGKSPALPVSPPAAPAKLPAPVPAPVPAPQPVSKVSVGITAPKSVKKNDEFTIGVSVSDVNNLYKAPMTLVYDPIFVSLVNVSEGGFLKQDGKPTSFSSKVDKNSGQVGITLSRAGDVGGVSGSGTLFTAKFKAINQGPANFGFLGVNLTDSSGKHLEAIPYTTVTEVK